MENRYDKMNVARIAEYLPTDGIGRFWYALEVVEGPNPPGTRLRHTFARPFVDPEGRLVDAVDPDDHRRAIGRLRAWARAIDKLHLWARRNGWTVEA